MSRLEGLEKQSKTSLQSTEEALHQVKKARATSGERERLEVELVIRKAAFRMVSDEDEAFDRQRTVEAGRPVVQRDDDGDYDCNDEHRSVTIQTPNATTAALPH
ncbi:unnamed protein product [Didymodactylos carnosus]|uniref:Uncharacterized protein n=1 Tax=Didymodactylos carnosus TaxID=1234261 RepID=A0A815UEK1_9BILA|nr:unnamed protein product [Didymodactylos carnosus]CAF1512908.1 unnamed protein product [Didymodactylos carnosus]CAF4198920.1 unnamed protein product [Didymodactylos carnosus]CAF4373322.1 unnamed protein product [Didymodactylos carnosus]